MKLTVQYHQECPHYREFVYLVEVVAKELQIEIELTYQQVTQEDLHPSLHYLGSPTLLVEGRDLEDSQQSFHQLLCRKYGDRDVPAKWLVESALLRVIKPRHILFLCVNNSARSQLAEAIARKYAPVGISVSSAGSDPTEIQPMAIQVLEEAGFYTQKLYAKSVSDIDPTQIECVITLCAEEVCPVFLGKAIRLHWGLPDPAAVQGPKKLKLNSFRTTRDELCLRLNHFFSFDIHPEGAAIS